MQSCSTLIALTHRGISDLARPEHIVDHDEAVAFEQGQQLFAVVRVTGLVGIDIGEIKSAVVGVIGIQRVESIFSLSDAHIDFICDASTLPKWPANVDKGFIDIASYKLTVLR